MRLGKFVLVFQAVVTLIIGVVFFVQFFTVGSALESNVDNLTSAIKSNITSPEAYELLDYQRRFQLGAYLLGGVGLLELVIISRFV